MARFPSGMDLAFGDWLDHLRAKPLQVGWFRSFSELFDGERWHRLHKVVDCFDLSQKRFQLIER